MEKIPATNIINSENADYRALQKLFLGRRKSLKMKLESANFDVKKFPCTNLVSVFDLLGPKGVLKRTTPNVVEVRMVSYESKEKVSE